MTTIKPQDLSRQHAQLRRLARAIVGESYADDVVQDVWAAALVHSGPAPRNADAWLNRVTRNIAWKSRLKDRRARAREVDRAGLGFADSSDMESPDALIAEVEEKHALERSVLELEEPYRSALLWRYYGGLTVKEVASKTGHNASTTRTHIQRGLEQLRGRLEKDGGTEWRAALVPLLGRGLDIGGGAGAASAAKPASGGIAGGAAVSVIIKAVAVAAAVTLLFIGARVLLAPAEAVEPETLQTIAAADEPAAEPDETLPDVLSPVVRIAAASVETASVSAAASVPAALLAGEETTVAVVEASSGKPLPGVLVNVRYAYLKKRGFFFKSTDFATETVTTDASGRAVIPVETNDEGHSASNSLSGTISTGDQPGSDVYLRPVAAKKDGVLELQLVEALAFRVRLPEVLTEEESGALKSTMVYKRGTYGVFTDSRVVQPISVDGRDLIFAFGRIDPSNAGLSATLHIATTPRGRTFHAEVAGTSNLATEPIEAVRANDVTHTFRLVHGVTGAPLAGELVSVGRPTERQPYASREAMGRTDENGAATMMGVPSGDVTMFVRAEGFKEFRSKAAFAAGATTEVRMVPKPDLRSVALTVGGPGRNPPRRVEVEVMTNDVRGSHVTKLSLVPVAQRGGRWSVTGVLENIPAEVCFLGATTSYRIHDAVGPIRIEPGQDEVEVQFGKSHKLTSVRLRLPPLIQAEYQQRAGEGPLYSMHGTHSSGGVVGTVEDDGRPVTWVVTAPGYLPAFGTEKAWRRVKEDGMEFIEITPDLRQGWGSLISAEHMEWDKEVPFHFRKEQPIAGVTIFDCATGDTLGVTDETGFVVITAAQPIQKIGARYGDKTKTFDLKGASGLQFGF